MRYMDNTIKELGDIISKSIKMINARGFNY